MKKLTTLSILFISLVFIAPIQVSAATNAGVKPGSFFYLFDTASEKINLFFTFNPEKKAKKVLESAEERLAEAEELTSENNPEAVKDAMENYKKNIEVLEKVLVKVPEEAKEAIKNAIEASKERQEEEIEETAELEKEVPENESEFEETENELKEEESDETAEIKDDKKDDQFKEIEKLKKEVEALKQKQPLAPKQSPTTIQNSQEQKKTEEKPKTTTTTLPNGAIVEMDANGNIIRIIKEAPQQIYIAPVPTTQNQTSITVQISSVNITPTITSAKIEWQTDKPTESKIFLSSEGLSSKLYKSESGLSTRHSVSVSGLIGDTNYSYEIEAIASETFAKKNGSFRTDVPLPVPKFVGLPIVTVIEKGILAEKLYTYSIRIETDIPTNVVFTATNAGYKSTSPATVHTFQVSVPVNYSDFSVMATSEGGTASFSGRFYDFY